MFVWGPGHMFRTLFYFPAGLNPVRIPYICEKLNDEKNCSLHIACIPAYGLLFMLEKQPNGCFEN